MRVQEVPPQCENVCTPYQEQACADPVCTQVPYEVCSACALIFCISSLSTRKFSFQTCRAVRKVWSLHLSTGL